MTRVWIAWFSVLAAVLTTTRAFAEPLPAGSRIAVLPTRGDAPSDATAAVEAYRELGYEVITPGEAADRLTRDTSGRACLEGSSRCDLRASLTALDADAVAVVAVWQRNGQAYEAAARVVRPDTEGTSTERIGTAPVGVAVRAAATAALARAEQSSLVQVRIESVPMGALVSVDRRQEATAPATFALSPGKHLLVVSHPGFVTRSTFVDVPPNAARGTVHRVELSSDALRGTSLLDTPAEGDRERSPWNFVLAGGLATVAVPLLVHGIYNAATVDHCRAEDEVGRCRQYVTFGAGAGASLGIGTAAALASAYLFVFQPFTVAAGRDDVSLTAGGTF